MKPILVVLILGYIAICSPGVQAQTVSDDVMILQGVLLNSNGTPRADGNYVASISWYSDSTGGRPLWTVRDVQIVQQYGAFAVEIQVVPNISKVYQPGQPIYGSITIDNVELSPRIRIAAVPLATRARYADQSASEVPVGSVIPFAGSSDNVPEGWLLCNGDLVLIESYPSLALVLNGRFNDDEGDLPTHFRLPDMRGMIVLGQGINRLASRFESAPVPQKATSDFDRTSRVEDEAYVEMHYIIRAK